MVHWDELICATEYLTLQAGCRINRCRYNGVRMSFKGEILVNSLFVTHFHFVVNESFFCYGVRTVNVN